VDPYLIIIMSVRGTYRESELFAPLEDGSSTAETFPISSQISQIINSQVEPWRKLTRRLEDELSVVCWKMRNGYGIDDDAYNDDGIVTKCQTFFASDNGDGGGDSEIPLVNLTVIILVAKIVAGFFCFTLFFLLIRALRRKFSKSKGASSATPKNKGKDDMTKASKSHKKNNGSKSTARSTRSQSASRSSYRLMDDKTHITSKSTRTSKSSKTSKTSKTSKSSKSSKTAKSNKSSKTSSSGRSKGGRSRSTSAPPPRREMQMLV